MVGWFYVPGLKVYFWPYTLSLFLFSFLFVEKEYFPRRRNFRYFFQKGVTPPAWDMWKREGGGTNTQKGLIKDYLGRDQLLYRQS